MTKADLANKVFQQIGGTKKESAELVEKLFDVMRSTIIDGESIKISGFGNFLVKTKHARKGRNPQTGGTIEISARRVLTFKPSITLRSVVNKDEKK